MLICESYRRDFWVVGQTLYQMQFVFDLGELQAMFRHLTLISAGGVYQEQVVELYYSSVFDLGEI